MIGEQLNFFLTPNDTEAVEHLLRRSIEFVIIKNRSKTGKADILPNLRVHNMGDEDLKICLIMPNDVCNVCWSTFGNYGESVVDSSRSRVIEFSRCYMSDNLLRRGRIYFVETLVDEIGNATTKEERFIKFAKKIKRMLSRKLKKVNADYYSLEASELRNSDLQFVMM